MVQRDDVQLYEDVESRPQLICISPSLYHIAIMTYYHL